MNHIGYQIRLIIDKVSPEQTTFWTSWQTKLAVIGGITTISLALYQAYQNLRERRRELQWKRADAASQMLDQMFEYNPSYTACAIFDEGFGSFELRGGNSETLTIDHMLQGLSNPDDTTGTSVNARRCFDALAYYLMRIDHARRIGLIDIEHIRQPVGYYISKFASHRPVIERYLTEINYSELTTFLGQFPAWTSRAPISTGG